MPGGGTRDLEVSACSVPSSLWRNMLQLHGKIVFLSELIRSEGRVVVSIGEMKGLPDPKAFQQLKVGSKGPVITYSYCVTYEFAEREELEDRGSPEVGA